MRDALTADLRDIPGCEVRTLLDARLLDSHAPPPRGAQPVGSLPELHGKFEDLARSSDAMWLIAPEIGGELARWVARAERLGVRLLGPGAPFIDRVSDKFRLSCQLSAADVPAIPGQLWRADRPWPPGIPFPAIVKPRLGAGCWGVRRCDDLESALAAVSGADPMEADSEGRWLVQPFVGGLATSVAAVGDGTGQYRILPACRQQIELAQRPHWTDLSYHGSELLTSPELARRATDLAQAALAALPPARGYLGLDLLLDASTPFATDLADLIVEVNARLTTSYLALRHAVPGLARSVVETVCPDLWQNG